MFTAAKTCKEDWQERWEKETPKVRLLNAGEREQLLDSVIEEDVLSFVLKEVPDKLISNLFSERMVFWLLLPEKIPTLVHSAAIKYLTLYKEGSAYLIVIIMIDGRSTLPSGLSQSKYSSIRSSMLATSSEPKKVRAVLAQAIYGSSNLLP